MYFLPPMWFLGRFSAFPVSFSSIALSLYILPTPQPKIYSTRAYHIQHYSGTAVSCLVPEMHKIALTVTLNAPPPPPF